jgi:hypothetical protein
MCLNTYTAFWKRKMEIISGHKKRAVIPLIWLLIYLSTAPLQLSGYVLCIGSDGHVEFEVAVDGRCTDTHDLNERHADVVISSVTAGESHCGSCLDLAIFTSLDIESYLVPIQDVLTHPFASTNIRIAHRTNSPTLLTPPPLLDISSTIDTTLVSLRTTTLLI